MRSSPPAPAEPSRQKSGDRATTKYRRGVETRERVIALARELIAEHGYAEVTLDQISAHAGVAKSSLLWHFGSKEMLLAEAAISLFREIEFAMELEGLLGKSVRERVDEVFARVADYFTRNPEAKGVMLGMLFSGSAPQTVREHIREGWNGHVRALVEVLGTEERPVPPEFGRVILALLHGCYCHWYANGRNEPISAYLDPAKSMILQWLE
jgi:AcrR family transcriptional regulator